MAQAQGARHFQKQKREERFTALAQKEKIALWELKKAHTWFGGEDLHAAILAAEEEGVPKNEKVENPFFGRDKVMFLSDTKIEDEPLAELIRRAVADKQNKRHEGKDKTVLIIDNRTTRFEPLDLQEALAEVDAELRATDFPEIYFYTGYYADNDGLNAEYSFAAAKLPDNFQKMLLTNIDERGLKPDKLGIVYE